MSYATPQDLLVYFQARELVKIAVPRHNPNAVAVDPVLLEAVINATDTNAWSADMLALTNQALQAMTLACEDASKEMDSYFVRRYPLPFSSDMILLNPLSRKCADIARYLLAERFFVSSDEAKQRYTEAITWLRDIGAGRAGLLVPSDNTNAVASPFRAVIGQATSNTHWGAY